MTDPPQAPWPRDLREATDGDAAGVLRLIGDCFAEYPGCVLDPDGIDAWMAAPASSYSTEGGQFWVLADAGREGLAACIGWAGNGPGRIELKNLYVSSRARRQGLGRRLVALVEATAREQGAATVVLWSDIRFQDAHRLYDGMGYQRTGEQRTLNDPSNSIEYGFVKRLGLESASS